MSRTRRRQAAFGLLEVILVFALVIGAGAIVFSVFQSANRRSAASLTVDKIHTLVANVQGSSVASVGQRSVLNTTSAKQAHLLTPGLATNGWGGAIEVADNTTYATPVFQVVIRNVPRDACADLVTGLMTNRSMIRTMMSVPGTKSTDLPFTGISVASPQSKAATYTFTMNQCSSAAVTGNTVDFGIYYSYTGGLQ